MKTIFTLLILAVLGWLTCPSLVLAAGGNLPASGTDGTEAWKAILSATDPSAAVAAYANGVAKDRADIRVQEAFVKRMIDFGLPEMAYHQAQLATGLDPTFGYGWAVLAYVSARQDRMAEALGNIVQAAELSSDDAFVQRTAGELLAWFDKKQPTIEAALKDSLEQTRADLNDRIVFKDAYERTLETLAVAAAEPAVTPQTPAAPTPEQSLPTYTPQCAGTSCENYAYSVPYSQGNMYDTYAPWYGYGGYNQLYGYGYGSDLWWWPRGAFLGLTFYPSTGFTVVERSGHHHHNGWNKGGGGWRGSGAGDASGSTASGAIGGLAAQNGSSVVASNGVAANGAATGARVAANSLAAPGGLTATGSVRENSARTRGERGSGRTSLVSGGSSSVASPGIFERRTGASGGRSIAVTPAGSSTSLRRGTGDDRGSRGAPVTGSAARTNTVAPIVSAQGGRSDVRMQPAAAATFRSVPPAVQTGRTNSAPPSYRAPSSFASGRSNSAAMTYRSPSAAPSFRSAPAPSFRSSPSFSGPRGGGGGAPAAFSRGGGGGGFSRGGGGHGGHR